MSEAPKPIDAAEALRRIAGMAKPPPAPEPEPEPGKAPPPPPPPPPPPGAGRQPMTPERAAEVMKKIEPHRFNVNKPPPPIAPILHLKGVPVGTAGNLVTLSGQAGSGKSQSLAAILGSSFGGSRQADFLGWELSNPNEHAVFYFDFEMSEQDSFTIIKNGALRRAGLDDTPNWFYSYNLVGMEPAEAREVVDAAFVHGVQAHGGVRAVIVDGVADLVDSPNDESESFAIVRHCHANAKQTKALIICVLHLNPSSDFKTRGHLGSQLERKSETVITSQRDGDTITIYSTKTRHKPIPKQQGQRIAWDDAAGAFVSQQSQAEAVIEGTQRARRQLACDIFAGEVGSITHARAVERIRELTGKSESTAKRRLGELREADLVSVQPATGLYSLGIAATAGGLL